MESLFVGIASGLVSGYLGVLLAMKQFKEQRAFDRQLEWYERTIRALGNVSRLIQQTPIMAQYQAIDSHELDKGLAELGQCINEAVLYAEQGSYEQLKTMGNKYKEIRDTAKHSMNQTNLTPLKCCV